MSWKFQFSWYGVVAFSVELCIPTQYGVVLYDLTRVTFKARCDIPKLLVPISTPMTMARPVQRNSLA
jgi:hypothetical protein